MRRRFFVIPRLIAWPSRISAVSQPSHAASGAWCGCRLRDGQRYDGHERQRQDCHGVRPAPRTKSKVIVVFPMLFMTTDLAGRCDKAVTAIGKILAVRQYRSVHHCLANVGVAALTENSP